MRRGSGVRAAWEGRGRGVRGVSAVWELREGVSLQLERGVSTAWGASSWRGRGVTGAWEGRHRNVE